MGYNDLTMDEKRRFLQGDSGKVLIQAIANSVAVLSWWGAAGHGRHYNGSMFFVNTGKALFGVTAKHVYEEYESCAVQYPVTCQIDNLPFNPISRFISRGVDCDVVTLRITQAELDELKRLTIPWPPVIPDKNQIVLYAGFPGIEKKFPKERHVDYGIYTCWTGVHSVNERDFNLVRDPDHEEIDTLQKGLPPRYYEMGGMSGGPVAILLEKPETGIMFWRLAGIIYESHPGFEIMKAVRADCINDDGQINC
jgi:hypothetical protein